MKHSLSGPSFFHILRLDQMDSLIVKFRAAPISLRAAARFASVADLPAGASGFHFPKIVFDTAGDPFYGRAVNASLFIPR